LTKYPELISSSWAELSQLDSKSREIVESARTCFAELGFEETTMVKIADVAGVGVATVYRRFGTKSAIVRYALMAESVRVGMVLNDSMAKSAGPIGALAETFSAFVAEASAPRLLTRSLRHSSAAGEMAQFLGDDAFLAQGRTLMGHFIRYWQDRGELGDFDADVVGEIFVRLVMSFISNPHGILPLRTPAAARDFAYQYLSPLLTPNRSPR
jgi:TetR/AcrR family transcriptional repressor of uid operon